uniref:Neuronal pentraxin-1-like n=1 Tax=Saccoglossus kowalevskii TaxID=10224 RepID=A0ABM0MI78_SACKO|nr:PREDICTED: neuronal pentraxin-1-like [Saccoglossus kowalevskii]
MAEVVLKVTNHEQLKRKVESLEKTVLEQRVQLKHLQEQINQTNNVDDMKRMSLSSQTSTHSDSNEINNVMKTFNFSGNSSVVLSSQDGIPHMKDYTMCLWMKNTNFSDEQRELVHYETSHSLKQYPFYYSITLLTHRICIQHMKGSMCAPPNPSSYFPSDGLWHHICLEVVDGSKMVVYVDGIHPNQSSWMYPFGNTSKTLLANGDIYLGHNHGVTILDRSKSFVGKITQFNMWDRQLGSQEISQLVMPCSVRRITSALVAVGNGMIEVDDIKTSLDQRQCIQLTVAPADGLYLQNVSYDENDFKVD